MYNAPKPNGNFIQRPTTPRYRARGSRDVSTTDAISRSWCVYAPWRRKNARERPPLLHTLEDVRRERISRKPREIKPLDAHVAAQDSGVGFKAARTHVAARNARTGGVRPVRNAASAFCASARRRMAASARGDAMRERPECDALSTHVTVSDRSSVGHIS